MSRPRSYFVLGERDHALRLPHLPRSLTLDITARRKGRTLAARIDLAQLRTAVLAFCFVLAGHSAHARGPDPLIADALAHAERFIVQVETVGGAQPLGALPASRTQHEDDDAQPAPDPNRFRDDPGSGFLLADGPTTGIVYAADGYILTSSFNFVREPSVVTVKLPDGRQLTADIVGRDKVRKLTLLKVDATGLETPEWAPREQVRPGQWALAVGRGFGGESLVSAGIVSAVGRMLGNAIQTDAKLSPANYGGPLLDSAGRVLGICVPMAQRPGELAGIEFYDAGVGFAVPGWRARAIAEELREGKDFHRGWLGMAIDPRAEDGVRIFQTADPSPMRSAGAERGDYITRINGREIKHYGQLVQALYMVPAGETVTVELLRGADTLEVELVLAQSAELGPLPPVEEPFDPAQPATEEESPVPTEEVP